MGGGLDFSEAAYRDVFMKGTCDDGCLALAKLLGWEVSTTVPVEASIMNVCMLYNNYYRRD